MKKPLKMPAPPTFLLKLESQKDFENSINKAESSNQPTENNQTPKSVDYILYQTALEDRRSAEIRTAEIYSKYVEMVNFSESLLKKISRFEIYKQKVKAIYQNALLGDKVLKENYLLVRQDLENTKRVIQDLNQENQSLQASVSAHQDAFAQVTQKMGQAEAAMEHANLQFQLLSEEFEIRGNTITDLQKKLGDTTIQLNEISNQLIDTQKRCDYLNDENLIAQNQLRESQIKESGLATLNQELTNSIPKLQKQIHILEEKLRLERDEFEKKTRIMNEEIDRLRENRLIDSLVEKSKETLRQPEMSIKEKVDQRIQSKEQWNEFYHKWSIIIDELSSHSAPMRKESKSELPPLPQLVSEHGDLDFK